MREERDVHGMLTFLLEGVLLLAVALVGLSGNLISFVTIFSQKIQKTFHNLLFLLTVFDMVRFDFCSLLISKVFINIFCINECS